MDTMQQLVLPVPIAPTIAVPVKSALSESVSH